MILRKRQQEFVEKSVTALKKHGNTLGIAPTGAGKTLMFSAVVGEFLRDESKALILAHRDELTAQNQEKFLRINPGVNTSVFDAKTKSFAGQAIFAMVQTLSRKENLSLIPAIDILAIDEGHHSVSPSYRNIIGKVKEKIHQF